MILSQYISRHDQANIIGSPGYRKPLESLQKFAVDDDVSIKSLQNIGITVQNPGLGNVVFVDESFDGISFDIDFSNRGNNCAIIERGAHLRGRLQLLCDGSTAVFCGGEYNSLTVFCSGNEALFYCGPRCYMGDLVCWIQGDKKILAIGEDCMFGWAIGIRTGDFHGIYDLDSKLSLNPPESTFIGPHVWLTNTIQVMKGVSIGAGSVIGASSIVNKNINKSCLAAGSPARSIRERIGWSRVQNPSEDEVNELLSRDYISDHSAVSSGSSQDKVIFVKRFDLFQDHLLSRKNISRFVRFIQKLASRVGKY